MFKHKTLFSGCLTMTLLTTILGLSPPTQAQDSLDDLVVKLCQTSIQVKLAANRGRERVNMTFESVERSRLSSGEESIRGQARVRGRNRERPLIYNCTVNVTDGLISQSSYTFDENIADLSTRLCQEELRQVVRQDRNGLVEFNRPLETYSVSNTEEGVRGTVLIRSSGQSERNYRFDCVVNLPEAQVTKISYRPDSGATADSQRIIRLCQDNIRQRISNNQIDLGGIIGINIGTGRQIEFQDPASTFSISENQEGVRGSATLVEGFRQRQVNYECTVNLQQGTVTNATVQ